jgi:ERCC4-related helicase
LHKLESIIKRLDKIVEDPDNAEPIQIMAMNSMTKNLRAAYEILKDQNVEELENELAKFEEEIRKIKAGRGERRVELVPEQGDDPKGHG